jgi:hypothetical protein
MDERERGMIDKLMLAGALEAAGVDSNTGEFLYVFTPKLKEVMPELYHQHLNYVNSEIMRLWEKGFVNVDLMSENPIVTLTEKSFDENALSSLDNKDRWGLEEIKRLLSAGEL